MARMIPPYISEEVKSTGEKRIFDLFQNDPATEEWIVLHSLGLSQHVTRLYGEIDFVVLAPGLGIFCLEVKSGSVSRSEGVWKFTNRFGKTNSKAYGPFEQAQEGMFSLIAAVRKKFGHRSHLHRLVFGYGVMFPHILFSVTGLEYQAWQIYDRDSARHPVSEFIEKLASYTRQKVKGKAWFDKTRSIPTRTDVEKLVGFLRGDFERLVSPEERLGDIEQQLQQYTAEQYHCLDQLRDNPRCLFQGAAGTGKTMIALESARRHLFNGQRVLLTCYNSMAGRWLAAQYPSGDQKLAVGNFHRLLSSFASSSNYDSEPSQEDDYFRYELPLMALEAVDRGDIEPFDCLIIDEGQDLIRSEYLDVFDSLVRGGLAGGNWEIYCDFERQAIYSDLTIDQMLDMFVGRASFARFRLTINCRNTRPIGKQTALLSGFEVSPFLPTRVDGLPVDYHFYHNPTEAVEKLSNLLLDFKQQTIPVRLITILSPYRLKNSCVAALDKHTFKIDDLTEKRGPFSVSKHITFSTIHSFKGLENTYIILADITRLNDPEFQSLLYVGMSRARAGLSVLIHEHARKSYEQLLAKSVGE